MMSLKAGTVDALSDALATALHAGSPPDSPDVMFHSPEDDDPAVLATSRMVEAMEAAAARLMRPQLSDGQSSVSIEMNLTYASTSALRAGGVGSSVRAVAKYLGVSGRLHRFSINAFDESGLVGSCEHARAVVVERRLSAQARKRAGGASMLFDV